MTASPPPAFPPAIPQLAVGDLARAIAYYQQQLGFSLDWRENESDLAGISRESCRLFLAGPRFAPRLPAGPTCLWLNLASVSEVDALHAAWAAHGATVLEVPERKPWNLYECTVADPDGNRLRMFFDMGTAEATAG